MKIKDIRHFRTFYKEKVREITDSNRNEHFIGVKYKPNIGPAEFGFFDLYHGDKEKLQTEGIRGFLEGFLDMARDGQAVYEFLQNAVDADSSHFAMFWEKDEEDGQEYLLVLNNGVQFDFAMIRSILNVGVSTKNPEDYMIGKFGIGFKLAHRLVGKDNGLDELINRNYGPILFSWKNGELENFLNFNGNEIITLEQKYEIKNTGKETKIDIIGGEPWLFKILITNFPCQPNEEIFDAYHNKTDQAFTTIELNRLAKWILKYSDKIHFEEFQHGSLFFVRLGEGKRTHLEQSNLEEGIKFSLSVLNHTTETTVRGLQHIDLNELEVQSVDLNFLEFTISKEKDSEEFRWIRFGSDAELDEDQKRSMEKDKDITFLMGYTDYRKANEVFANAPNFYLFFPLSEEKHKFKFILHSNAFYKASHRTSLHVGTPEKFGINERLLEAFSKRLIQKLDEWLESNHFEERKKFLEIYANILISEESSDNNRDWINLPLIYPLQDYIVKRIPVQDNEVLFNIQSNREKVRIKDTKLPIDPSDLGLDLSWFYWNGDDILNQAAKTILNIDNFNIINVLYVSNSSRIINKLIINDLILIQTILDEIDFRIGGERGSLEILKENLYSLRLFEFEDSAKCSINDLIQDEKYNRHLILFEEIESIADEIRRAGFIISIFSLSKYPYVQKFFKERQPLKYFEYQKLNEILSEGFEKTDFTPEEKLKIFKVLEKAKEKENEQERNQRMQVLRLFCNRQGNIVALGQLIKVAQKAWLNAFCINSEENHDDLTRYLVKDEREAYTRTVIPLWDLVVEDKTEYIRSIIPHFYKDITELQEQTRQSITLSDKRFIFINNKFIKPNENIFYRSEWTIIGKEDYSNLETIFKNLFSKILPDSRTLPYLNSAPFNLKENDLNDLNLLENKYLSLNEIKLLSRAFEVAQLPLNDKFILEPTGERYKIKNKGLNEMQVWTYPPDQPHLCQ